MIGSVWVQVQLFGPKKTTFLVISLIFETLTPTGNSLPHPHRAVRGLWKNMNKCSKNTQICHFKNRNTLSIVMLVPQICVLKMRTRKWISSPQPPTPWATQTILLLQERPYSWSALRPWLRYTCQLCVLPNAAFIFITKWEVGHFQLWSSKYELNAFMRFELVEKRWLANDQQAA